MPPQQAERPPHPPAAGDDSVRRSAMTAGAITDDTRDQVRGTLLAIGGVAAISPDALLLRLLGVSTPQVLFWRGLFMSVGIFAALVIRHRGRVLAQIRRIGMHGAAVSVLFVIGTICFVTSIANTEVANTLVIISASPLFAAALGRLFLRESLPLRTLLAIAGSVTGIVIIVSGSLETGGLAGDLLAVGTALVNACVLTVVRHGKAESMQPAFVFGGILLALVALPLAGSIVVPARDLGLLAILGFGVMGISMSLINAAPRYIPAAEVGLILLLETVLGPIWVWLGVGEVPHTAAYIGGGVVIVSLVTHTIVGMRRVSSS